MDAWRARFAAHGWVTCPLVAMEGTSTFSPRTASVGIPHPKYGVMRATVIFSDTHSLTRLAGVAHEVASTEFATSDGLPHLYVGSEPFVDFVDDTQCTVMGILVFAKGLDIEYAPLTVVDWHGMALPYFTDANGWVMTGWDTSGRVSELSKPFGWGCIPLRAGPSPQSSVASVCGAA